MAAEQYAPLTPEEAAEAERNTRLFIWRAFGYKTHEPDVDRFHLSRARTKIVSCPARTAKSYSAWKDVLPDILIHGARAVDGDPTSKTQVTWIVAPNYVLAKEFDYAWQDLVERAPAAGFNYRIERKLNNATQGDMQIIIDWGFNKTTNERVKDIITVKSATNINVLQSEEVDIAILSEAARLPSQVWTKFLSQRVKRSIWPTTPDIEAKWIWDQIQLASNPDLGIECFHFTGKANPGYDWARYWVEHMKTESIVAGRVATTPDDKTKAPSGVNGHDCFDPIVGCEAMKEPGFAEQFGGQWTFHRGRVVPIRAQEGSFGEPSHVIHTDPKWVDHADIHISLDYGYADPTVVMFWFVGPSQVYLRTSIYERGLTPDDAVARVHGIIDRNGWKGRVKRMIGDPKKPEVVEVFRRRGLPIWDIDKKAQADRKAGHLELMNYLALNPKTGEPYMLIHSSNHEVIDEWGSLRYKDTARDPNATGSFVGRDDAYDCARYFVMSHPPTKQEANLIKFENSDFAKVKRMILNQRRRTATVPMTGRSGLSGVGL